MPFILSRLLPVNHWNNLRNENKREWLCVEQKMRKTNYLLGERVIFEKASEKFGTKGEKVEKGFWIKYVGNTENRLVIIIKAIDLLFRRNDTFLMLTWLINVDRFEIRHFVKIVFNRELFAHVVVNPVDFVSRARKFTQRHNENKIKTRKKRTTFNTKVTLQTVAFEMIRQETHSPRLANSLTDIWILHFGLFYFCRLSIDGFLMLCCLVSIALFINDVWNISAAILNWLQ